MVDTSETNSNQRKISTTVLAVKDAALDSVRLEEQYASSYKNLKEEHASIIRDFEEKNKVIYKREQLENLISRFKREQSIMTNADEEIGQS